MHSISVGFTRWQAGRDSAPLAGPAPEFFFASDEMTRRGRELAQRYAEGWQGFAPVLGRTLRIDRVTDGDELMGVWRDTVKGRTDPTTGYVLSLEVDRSDAQARPRADTRRRCSRAPEEAAQPPETVARARGRRPV